MIFMTSPEQVRHHLGLSQRQFSEKLGIPLRTYEDKVRHGFKQIDLFAAKWVYLKETEGTELN